MGTSMVSAEEERRFANELKGKRLICELAFHRDEVDTLLQELASLRWIWIFEKNRRSTFQCFFLVLYVERSVARLSGMQMFQGRARL